MKNFTMRGIYKHPPLQSVAFGGGIGCAHLANVFDCRGYNNPVNTKTSMSRTMVNYQKTRFYFEFAISKTMAHMCSNFEFKALIRIVWFI